MFNPLPLSSAQQEELARYKKRVAEAESQGMSHTRLVNLGGPLGQAQAEYDWWKQRAHSADVFIETHRK